MRITAKIPVTSRIIRPATTPQHSTDLDFSSYFRLAELVSAIKNVTFAIGYSYDLQ